MDVGERLSAYVAGELDAEERRALEAALADDPELRARLERVREVDRLLGAMPTVDPPPDFSARLREQVAAELAASPHDEFAERRGRRVPLWASLRPLAVAGAAAAVILVVGVGAGIVLRGGMGGGDDAAVTEMAADTAAGEAGPAVTVLESDNDYSDLELQRLAVNVDTQFVIPPGLTESEAVGLQEQLLQQLQGTAAALDDTSAFRAGEAETETESAATEEEDRDGAAGAEAEQPVPAARLQDPLAAATACLPTLLEEHPEPFVPVSAELARYQGRPAVIYVIGTEDPQTGTYNRVEAWAVGTDGCQVLSRAEYDRG